jgi:hypothetical protein
MVKNNIKITQQISQENYKILLHSSLLHISFKQTATLQQPREKQNKINNK